MTTATPLRPASFWPTRKARPAKPSSRKGAGLPRPKPWRCASWEMLSTPPGPRLHQVQKRQPIAGSRRPIFGEDIIWREQYPIIQKPTLGEQLYDGRVLIFKPSG